MESIDSFSKTTLVKAYEDYRCTGNMNHGKNVLKALKFDSWLLSQEDHLL